MWQALIAVCTVAAMIGAANAVEVDVDRPGKDYRSFDIDQANPGPCESACAAEAICRAWTYVKPGIQGPRARCWLKFAVPQAYTSSCCISGVAGDDPETAEIREVQSLLATLGYDPGPIDGKPGRQTTAAIRRFQSRYDLTANGRISPELVKGLWGVAGARAPVAPSMAGDTDDPAPPATKPTTPADDLSGLDRLE